MFRLSSGEAAAPPRLRRGMPAPAELERTRMRSYGEGVRFWSVTRGAFGKFEIGKNVVC